MLGQSGSCDKERQIWMRKPHKSRTKRSEDFIAIFHSMSIEYPLDLS